MKKYRYIMSGTLVLTGAFLLFVFLWAVINPPHETLNPKQKDLTTTGSSIKQLPVQTGVTLTYSGDTTFHMPNLEWKTRDITLADGRTLHYVFGEGNPKEVALDKEGLADLRRECAEHNTDASLSFLHLCDMESGLPLYVSRETERALVDALSDPYWEKLATECALSFQFVDRPEYQQSGDPADIHITYDTIFSSGGLDTDKFLFVEPSTGLKALDYGTIEKMALYLRLATYKGLDMDPTMRNPNGDCVDRYGSGIINKLLYLKADYLGFGTFFKPME